MKYSRVITAGLAVAIAGFSSNSAEASYKPKYRISITNITKGQPITPPVLVLHRSKFKLFELGQEASPGLQRQAKDGDPSVLVGELEANSNVRSVILASDAPILPGQTVSVDISASYYDKLSVSTMLARTNDAFAGLKGVSLKSASYSNLVYGLKVYDAGAEINNQDCAYIPAPPCNNPFMDTEDKEGFVHSHPGVLAYGDLDPVAHSFGTIAAKVKIERIK